jgi:hypothetical protein
LTRPKLTVIKGGLATSVNDREKRFISAYVTDIRLMGVIVAYARWEIVGDPDGNHLHQFFYIDCEEMGLETYKSVSNGNITEVEIIEQALVGGLGSSKIPVSERQLRGLLTYYKEFNELRGLPLPANLPEYRFVIEPNVYLSPQEDAHLMNVLCGEITSNYQVVNYFLMRCFGRDYTGAAYLANGEFPLNLYDNYIQATFHKNVIDKSAVYADGTTAYLCESLVEMGGNHEIVISKIVVKDLKVIDFEHCSGFAVSSAEAAMMLSKPEFVTVYEVLLSDEDMEDNLGELSISLESVMSRQENGRLFMAYKPNNAHVDNRIFRLNNDINGVYYLTDYGQLIIAAYSLVGIHQLEKRLSKTLLAPFLMPTAKYEFIEPVLFEFINSDFEDFEDFLEVIKED